MKYFKMQWNSVCEGNPEIIREDVFAHSWIGLKLKPEYCLGTDSQTEGIIHLDPWISNRVAAYLSDKHPYSDTWNYYGKIFDIPGPYEGIYFKDGIIDTVHPGREYTSWVKRWPKWLYERK